MKYDSKLKFLPVKTKTIILVVAIYIILSVIFFSIRYLDIKDFAATSQNTQLQRVKQVYEETLKRTVKFYTTRGYANINSYGIKEAFLKKDKSSLHRLSLPRWNVIRKENHYLKSFCFYDKNGKLLTYFGKKPGAKLLFTKTSNKISDGFWFNSNGFNYHTISISRDKKSNIIGFVVFVIEPDYFLSEIRKLINIFAYISFKKPNHKKLVYMIKNSTKMGNIIKDGKIKNSEILKINGGVFLPYMIKGKGINPQYNFKIIFLQDILHWNKIIQQAILQNLIIMFILVIVTIMVINYGFDKILKELDNSNDKLIKSQNELEELNKNLQINIEQETRLRLRKEREVNEKERILVHQSKLASMGEMIGNIAHQWRQPLTELSSILINVELYFEKDKLTKEKLSTKIKEANNQITFMSKTIDDFRNFFSSGKKKQYINISTIINKVTHLMISSLHNNNIELKTKIIDDFTINCYPNEMSQALLNIISNAKDIVKERNIKNATISLKAFKKDKINIITIEDNGGGINIIPIDKIFEPYFSTKHAKIGTGIGLYMTKTIIEKNNNGKIEIKNGKEGAIFTIIF